MKFIKLPLPGKREPDLFNAESIRALGSVSEETTEVTFSNGDAIIVTLPLSEVLERLEDEETPER